MPTFTMTKSYDNLETLTEGMLDDMKNSTETFMNTTKLDSANIQVDAVAEAMTSTGADAIASSMSASGADAIFNKVDGSHTISAAAANKIKVRQTVTIDPATAVAGQVLLTNSSGNYTTSSASFATPTNLTGSLTVVGNPVNIELKPDGVAAASLTGITAGNTFTGHFAFFRDSTMIADIVFNEGIGSSSNGSYNWGTGTISAYDNPGAGTYVYSCQVKLVVGTSIGIANCKLKAKEEFA